KFERIKPSKHSIETALLNDAKSKFNSILFWKNKKKHRQFISDNLETELEKAIRNWALKKEKFEKLELVKEKEVNLRHYNAYKQQKKNLIDNLNAEETYVLNSFEALLKEIS